MSAIAPGFYPLIAEAKLRMRRRRVLMAVLVLLAGAGVLFLILRPSGAPGTTRVTPHGRNGNGNAVAHLKVSVDAAERAWRTGINHLYTDATGLTLPGAARLRRTVVTAAHKTGATIVRIRVWSTPGAVEVVLATRMNPAEYLAHRAHRLVTLLGRDYPYVKVVNGRGSRIFEWYDLPRGGMVGVPPRLRDCSPVQDWGPTPPPCPVK